MTGYSYAIKTIEFATQIHPQTGQEIADLDGPITVRPVKDREMRAYALLPNVRGRNVYITVDDADTQTNGGFLVASRE